MAQTIFHVPDITCGHCQLTVTNALTPVAGVRSVAVDIATKQVSVDYDEAAVSEEQLETVLAEQDYPVASRRA